MTDYLDRLEQQLTAASSRLHQADNPAPEPSRRWMFGGRRGRIGLGVVLAALATGSAVAAINPWAPESVTDRDGQPGPRITASAAPADITAALGVLRRTPTASDRAPDLERLLVYAGTPKSTNGIRTDLIRRVGTTPAGAPIVLVPLTDWTPDPSIPVKRDPVCLIYPEPGNHGAAKGCWTLAEIRAGTAQASLGQHVYGVVPDGVTTVTAVYDTGPSATATVNDNAFDLAAPRQMSFESTFGASSDGATPAIPRAFFWTDKNGTTIPQRAP